MLNHNGLKWIAIAALTYVLLVAVAMISAGFKTLTGDQAKELFALASNPITGLFIGTVCTALLQSSSTVTSIIVGLVAGGLPVNVAIPMIMGANVGTTVTNTIVSIGHLRDNEEFKRAFSAATVHDLFNVLGVLIFLPLEIAFGLLEKISGWLSDQVAFGESLSIAQLNILKPIIKAPLGVLNEAASNLSLSKAYTGALLIALGIVFIFLVISFLGKLLRSLLDKRSTQVIHSAMGKNAIRSVSSGALVTVLVQSSSTTTSLIIPLAGAGLIKLKQAYTFTLGANIGTCITALLAATAISGQNAYFAMQIALVHFLYNVLAVLLIYGTPLLRDLPLRGAQILSTLALRSKVYVGAYLVFTFFILPVFFIAITT